MLAQPIGRTISTVVTSQFAFFLFSALTIITLSFVCSEAGHAALITKGRCGQFPKVVLATPKSMCVGLVAGTDQGLTWPRSIIEIDDGQFIITDAVGWHARGKGRLLRLMKSKTGAYELKSIIQNRNLPHGLALGPDHLLYVGDDDQIWRFDPKNPDRQPEVLRDGLPGKPSRGGDHWHPFKQIIFDANGDLIVNFGAPIDACDKPPETASKFSCGRIDAPGPDAALWKLNIKWPQGQPGKFEPIARGLRNSMALAVSPRSGLLFQAENNIDRWNGKFEEDFPAEELNIILAGKHYGWPFCVGFGKVVPPYKNTVDCRNFEKPYFLLPAHSSPLAMSFYQGKMFPELSGKLIVALHGFKKYGHRIVAYETDDTGKPKPPAGQTENAALPNDILLSTSPHARSNVIRPSGMTIAHDGAIWFVDDKAKAILVLLRDNAAQIPESDKDASSDPSLKLPPPAGWDQLYHEVLSRRCAACHAAFHLPQSAQAWTELQDMGFLDPANLDDSLLFRAILARDGVKAMPPPPEPRLNKQELGMLFKFLSN